jgi:hypothetical protein
MSIEGTVQISIMDFDELRNKAKSFDELKSKIRNCTNVEVNEIDDDTYIQVISVNGDKMSKLAAQYSDCEEVFEDDVIKIV